MKYLVLLCCVYMLSCKQEAPVAKEVRMQKTYPDWCGTYVGVLPCEDCRGIETILTLQRDHFFRLITTRLGKGEQASIQTGKYAWNQDSTIIILDINAQSPVQYYHHINGLYQLDPEGNRITGPNAEQYKLTRTMESMLAQYRWNLRELLGKYLEGSSAHIRFDDDGRVISGYGWCNTFEGEYEFLGDDKVRFGEMISMGKNCPDSTIEQQFLNVFKAVNTYHVENGVLSLSRGDNEPVVKFEASRALRR